jgi:hypothetical protein
MAQGTVGGDGAGGVAASGLLPADLWPQVLAVAPESTAMVLGVSRDVRTSVLGGLTCPRQRTQHPSGRLVRGSRGYHPLVNIPALLASRNLSLLAWARSAGCPWDARFTAAAARSPHAREALRWARQECHPPCPWDARVCAAAAEVSLSPPLLLEQ